MVKDLTEDLQAKCHHAYFDKFLYLKQPGSREEKEGSMDAELPERTGVVSRKSPKI